MEQLKDPGLGNKFSAPVKRFLNKDGTYNINRLGGVRGIKDFYKYLLDISWQRFLVILFGTYTVFNLIFALLYLAIGLDQLSIVHNDFHPFWTAFFFSAQTLTTLGYGNISPLGFGANLLATSEAFIGLSTTALATGILYGRFSKPLLKLAFSQNAIITPFEGGKALMFKMVNTRDNVLIKSKINAIFIIDKGEGQDSFNKGYHNLKLETDSILFFPLTWTAVHKITEDSPLYKLKVEDLMKRNAELIVLFETFDETFGQEMIQKHSYADNQWLENVKFDMSFGPDKHGHLQLHVKNIDSVSPVTS
ncbi:MAG: ion channel [Crocinitomicaceae bacterium]